MNPPSAATDEALQPLVDQEIRKAKDALTNLVLLGLAEQQGSTEVLKRAPVADGVEYYWRIHLKDLLPRVVANFGDLLA